MTIASRRLARRCRERALAEQTQLPTTVEPANADPDPHETTEAQQENVDAAK
jgi:hypothetical protein